MTEGFTGSGATGGDEALPVRRGDLQQGLRYVHEMLSATQERGIEAIAFVRALVYVLAEKGIIRSYELDGLVKEARREASEELRPRVRLGTTRDKYTAAGAADVDCASLIPICHARCCTFAFFLCGQDLDEGVVRWDYGNPYWIKQGTDGYCTHSDPDTRFCTIHGGRPFVCRKYDCRDDERVWLDFAARIPALPVPAPGDDPVAMAEVTLYNARHGAQQNQMDLDGG